MTDSGFVRLWHLWSCFQVSQQSFSKVHSSPRRAPLLLNKIQSILVSRVVPTKYNWWRESTIAQIYTESLSLPHAFLYSFTFLHTDYSPRLFKFLPTKILSLKDSPKTSTIFFRTTFYYLKSWQCIFSLI